MTVCPDMVNGFGVRHGALVTAVTDSAFAFASNTYDDLTMAAGFDMVLVRPARVGDVLGATATERHRRGRNGSYDVTVRRMERNGDEAEPGETGADEVVGEFRGRSRSLGWADPPT